MHESLVGVWRRRYSQDGLQEAEVKLLPVHVPIETPDRVRQANASVVPRALGEGAIHIELSHGHRLSVRGEVPPNTLSAVIRELSRS